MRQSSDEEPGGAGSGATRSGQGSLTTGTRPDERVLDLTDDRVIDITGDLHARTAAQGPLPAGFGGARRGGGGHRTRGGRDARGERAHRAVVLFVLYALAFTAVVVRLGQVQLTNSADEYAARGAAQRERTITLSAERGRIYDRNGNVLALSIDAASVYADPSVFRPRVTESGETIPGPPAEPVATRIAAMLDLDPDWVLERITQPEGRFTYLKRQVEHDLGQQILAERLPGINVLTEQQRVYPAGQLGAQVLGFVNIDGDGQSGVEREFDTLLRGRAGELVIERAPRGLQIASGARELVPSVAGTDVVLTLDREIQHATEAALASMAARTGAVGASAVVIDVRTGDVLAMGSVPTFDPNEPGDYASNTWRARAATDVLEPGSVQKTITAIAALEEGIVEAGTTMLVDDTIEVGGKEFTDSHTHDPEWMTFAEVIETSSNVGTIMVAEELGEQRLGAWLHAFGFGRAPGLGLPGETAGLLLDVDDWSATSLPTIAIGHGIGTTTLQLATAYATVANDGVALEPRIVRGTVGDDGTLAPSADAATRTVVSAETATEMRRILRRVVEGERGTGKLAAVPGYTVAGKTGTARKPRADGRGYHTDKYVATFVGMVPAEDPEIVIAVAVDEPYPIWGGVVAAPVFSEIATFALPHLQIAPTRGDDLEPLAEWEIDQAQVDAALEGPADGRVVLPPAPDGTSDADAPGASDDVAGDPAQGASPDETAANETAANETAANETAANETAADETAADEAMDDETGEDRTSTTADAGPETVSAGDG